MKKWVVLGGLFMGLFIYSFRLLEDRSQGSHHSVSPLDSPKIQEPGDSVAPTDREAVVRSAGGREVASRTFKEAFSRKYPSDWQIQEGSQGKPFRVLGGTIKGVGKSLDLIMTLAQDLAQLNGVTNTLFRYSSKQATTLSITYFLNQTFEGFDVYNGWVQVTTNHKTGDVYLMDLSIKSVNEDVRIEILVPQDQAKDLVTQEYPKGVEVKALSSAPKVWTEDSDHELVWEFHAEVTSSTELADYKVVVGAHTGQVRAKFKVSVDD